MKVTEVIERVVGETPKTKMGEGVKEMAEEILRGSGMGEGEEVSVRYKELWKRFFGGASCDEVDQPRKDGFALIWMEVSILAMMEKGMEKVKAKEGTLATRGAIEGKIERGADYPAKMTGCMGRFDEEGESLI